MASEKVGVIWSDIHPRIIPDGLGGIKIVENVASVMGSIDNILRTRKGERCLSGDTQISLLDGRSVPIKDMVSSESFWVYSFDHQNGTIVPGLARARKTGRRKLIRVVLDSGDFFDCTLDHKIMLRNGHYLEAGNLCVGQPLMPLYLRDTEDGYLSVYQPMKKNWQRVHRLVAYWKSGYFGVHSCVHHKNFVKTDNRPENLMQINKRIHWRYHAKRVGILNRKLWYGEDYKWYRDKMKSGSIQCNTASDPKFSMAISSGIQKHLSISGNRERWSNRTSELARNTFNRPDVKQKLREIGHRNGTFFQQSDSMKESREKNREAMRAGQRRALETKEYQEMLVDNGRRVGKRSIGAKLNKHIPLVEEIYGEFNQQTWEIYRNSMGKSRCAYPTWESIEKSGLLVYLNHKVAKIVDLGCVDDVYDIQVDKYHNFALSSGVFVHNCMLPSFGSNLGNMLFENMDDALMKFIAHDVKESIEIWDNRVSVEQVQVVTDPDRSSVSIVVKFRIRGYGNSIFEHKVLMRGE